MPEPQLICTVNAVICSPMPSPQRRNPRRVHLVGNDVDATQDHLIEGIRRERLTQQ